MGKLSNEKLIAKAHDTITRTKGKEYAPTAKEIEDKIKELISKKKKIEADESKLPFNPDEDEDDVTPTGSSDWRKKKDVKEMGAEAAGGYEAPLFTTTKQKLQEGGVLGTGEYDVPAFGKTPKGGRKDPLKIDGPDSIYKGRAVKDKNFPKWGGPDSVFVKVKEKCKKFPYCNQGDTGALEFIKEDDEFRTAIEEASKLYKLPYEDIQNVVINELKKIFISYEN